jgi:hypothetical protein
MLGSKETDKTLQNPLWNEKMQGFPKKNPSQTRPWQFCYFLVLFSQLRMVFNKINKKKLEPSCSKKIENMLENPYPWPVQDGFKKIKLKILKESGSYETIKQHTYPLKSSVEI